MAERRAFSLQGHWSEVEASFIASYLGLDRLGLLANLAGLADVLLLEGDGVEGVPSGMVEQAASQYERVVVAGTWLALGVGGIG